MHVVMVLMSNCRLSYKGVDRDGSWKKLTPRMWCCYLNILASHSMFLYQGKGNGG